MLTASYYSIGSTHDVCQDYAFANKQLIAVSDGCSSSPDTDFGSRLLVKATQKVYSEKNLHLGDDYLLTQIWGHARNSASSISSLELSCLDATLLVANNQLNSIDVMMIGDGTVTVKAKDGMIFTKIVEYKDNAPLYLCYLHNKERKDLLEASFDCTKIITEYMHKNGVILNTTKRVSTNDIEKFSFAKEDYESVTLFSDGISSFVHKKDGKYSRIPEHLIIEHMVKYKNIDGGYTPNHYKKILDTLASGHNSHTDDFSVASFIIDK